MVDLPRSQSINHQGNLFILSPVIYLIGYLLIACLVFHLSAKYVAVQYPDDDFEFEDLLAFTTIACFWPLMVPIIIIIEMPMFDIVEKIIQRLNKIYKKK